MELLLSCLWLLAAFSQGEGEWSFAGKRTEGKISIIHSLLITPSLPSCTVVLFGDGSLGSLLKIKDYSYLQSAWGASVFLTPTGAEQANMTQESLSKLIHRARQLRRLVFCVTLIVISDDTYFLSSFSEISLKKRFLKPKMLTLIFITSFPLHKQRTSSLHKFLTRTNSVYAVVTDYPHTARGGVYLEMPFTGLESAPIRVASWSAGKGVRAVSKMPVFFDKFVKFPHRPHIVVTSEQFPSHVAIEVEDPEAPGGKRVTFRGTMENVMQVFSNSMNFSYSYKRPDDKTWGGIKADGTATGMLAMVIKEEAEIALGPFNMNPSRNDALDITGYIAIMEYRILATRGRPTVDPWGFLLPLTPLVWTLTLTALLGVLSVILVLRIYLFLKFPEDSSPVTFPLSCVRVMLQQDIGTINDCWWWERVVLGVWMLMLLVLTRSYAGTLTSLLAIRNIEYPFQGLRQVLDEPHIAIIIQKDNNNIPYFRTVKSGIFREVGDLLDSSRIDQRLFTEFSFVMDTLVRRGSHVFFDVEVNLRNMMANDFSVMGRCDFYMSSRSYLQLPLTILAQKNSPLTQAIRELSSALMASGLFSYWLQYSRANSTVCLEKPRIITVTAVLSLHNVMGMFSVLAAGFIISSLVLLQERLAASMCKGRMSS